MADLLHQLTIETHRTGYPYTVASIQAEVHGTDRAAEYVARITCETTDGYDRRKIERGTYPSAAEALVAVLAALRRSIPRSRGQPLGQRAHGLAGGRHPAPPRADPTRAAAART